MLAVVLEGNIGGRIKKERRGEERRGRDKPACWLLCWPWCWLVVEIRSGPMGEWGERLEEKAG